MHILFFFFPGREFIDHYISYRPFLLFNIGPIWSDTSTLYIQEILKQNWAFLSKYRTLLSSEMAAVTTANFKQKRLRLFSSRALFLAAASRDRSSISSCLSLKHSVLQPSFMWSFPVTFHWPTLYRVEKAGTGGYLWPMLQIKVADLKKEYITPLKLVSPDTHSAILFQAVDL